MTAADPPRTGPTSDRAGPPAGAVRCSTAEREQTSRRLSEAAGEGRSSLAEKRIGQAYAATFRHELDALTADLPQPVQPSGWAPVLGMVGHQPGVEAQMVLGRLPATRARRARALIVAAAAVLVLLAAMVMIVHGILAEGPEHVGEFAGGPAGD